MSAINLDKSIQKLKKCYAGKDKDGTILIDKSKLNDDLAFGFAMFRVSLAIKNKEITEKELVKSIKGSMF